MGGAVSVSIVMPVYNEEEVLEKTVREYYAQVIDRIIDSEFILVNDSSTDGSAAILARLRKELPRLIIVNLKENSGHSEALKAGFLLAKGRFVFHVDSDNQFYAQDFWELYRSAEENDIVLGWRQKRCDALHRKAISAILRFISMSLFGAAFKDPNSPFKIIKADVLREVINELPARPVAISVLILLIAHRKKYRIKEIAVRHLPRKTGTSKLKDPSFLVKGCIRCVWEMLQIRLGLSKKT